MSEYTPTTALVRHNYGAYGAPAVEFDRWLAEVRATALEEAADEITLDYDSHRERRTRPTASEVNAEAAAEVWLRARAQRIRQETIV